MTDGSPSHPPAWLPDGYGNLRWWDGTQWTEHLVPGHPLARPVAAPPVVADTRRRVLAYLIDMVLMVPGIVIYMWAFFDGFFGDMLAPVSDNPIGPNVAWLLIGWGLAVVAYVVNRGIVQGLSGKSLGKKIMKLSLVRIDGGRPPGLWWGLLRWLLEWLVGVVDIILGFVTERRQRVGDIAAKTIVLNDEDVDRVTGRTGTVG